MAFWAVAEFQQMAAVPTDVEQFANIDHSACGERIKIDSARRHGVVDISALASGVFRDFRSEPQCAAPGRLDVGRRRRIADSPGAGAIRRGCRRHHRARPSLYRIAFSSGIHSTGNALGQQRYQFAASAHGHARATQSRRRHQRLCGQRQVILRAIKKYGMIAADNGSDLLTPQGVACRTGAMAAAYIC